MTKHDKQATQDSPKLLGSTDLNWIGRKHRLYWTYRLHMTLLKCTVHKTELECVLGSTDPNQTDMQWLMTQLDYLQSAQNYTVHKTEKQLGYLVKV